MSDTAFIELLSEDPIERAIACRVVRLMGDHTLNEPRRVRLVRKAQRELIAHRQNPDTRQALLDHMGQMQTRAQLPEGFRPQSIQVSQGRLVVGGLTTSGQHHQAFTWIDAGAAPQVGPRQAANSRAYTLQRSGIPANRGRTDPIAERRKALGLKPTQTQSLTPSPTLSPLLAA